MINLWDVNVEAIDWPALAADERDALLDELAEIAHDEWAAEAEAAAEAAAERFYEEGPHGSMYAGSQEEARDRWLDSMQEGAF